MRIAFPILFFTVLACSPIERPLTVYAFLSTECPLSIEQTGTLNILHQRYKSTVIFTAVFPNFTDHDTLINAFVDKYQIRMNVINDQQHILKDSLGATVTPQYFLLDSKGRVLYSGQCDNRMISLGKKRKVVTEHYLNEAIEQALSSKWVQFHTTEPIGCAIFNKEVLCSGV